MVLPAPPCCTGRDRAAWPWAGAPGARRLGLALIALSLGSAVLVGCRSADRPDPAAPLAGRLSGSAHDTDVTALGATDFALRSAAAERLVALGPEALPALGAAGDQAVDGIGGAPIRTTAPVVAAILATQPDAAVADLLASPHATLRRAAAVELGQRSAWTPIPRLIERLEDREPAVREAAHSALRRLTHEFLETSGRPGPGESASLSERWRRWWNQTGRARAAGTASPDAG